MKTPIYLVSRYGNPARNLLSPPAKVIADLAETARVYHISARYERNRRLHSQTAIDENRTLAHAFLDAAKAYRARLHAGTPQSQWLD